MDIFGIGAPELIFIILIALIILGPKEMEKTGRTIGRFLRDMTRSEGWRVFRDTSREIRNLPNRLMREANIEDIQKNVGDIGKEIEDASGVKGFGTWANPSAAKPKAAQTRPQPAESPENQIAPPKATPSPEKESNKETDKEPDNDA